MTKGMCLRVRSTRGGDMIDMEPIALFDGRIMEVHSAPACAGYILVERSAYGLEFGSLCDTYEEAAEIVNRLNSDGEYRVSWSVAEVLELEAT